MAGSNHGHTLAAWTGVTIAFIGFTVAGLFTVMAEPLGVAAGGVVVVLGGLAGLAMRAAGMGQPKVHPQLQQGQAARSQTVPAQSGQPQTAEAQAQS